MTDPNRAIIQPASSVAAPALRKRFYEAHRFLSRVAQFPLVLAKLHRDGLEHPEFFSALSELLPLERLCFCLWDTDAEDSQPTTLWLWEEKTSPSTTFVDLDPTLLQHLRHKPLRFNECRQEIEQLHLLAGEALWGPNTRSMLVLPLHFGERFLGLLLVCAEQAARYNDGDFAHAQFLADALAPMVAHRLEVESHHEVERNTSALVEQAQDRANAEIYALRTQLAEAQKALEDAEDKLEEANDKCAQSEQDQLAMQKRLQANKEERTRLHEELLVYREERQMLRQLCERFEREATRMTDDGEQLRQVLLRTHRSISMFRQLAEQRIKDGLAASQTQTELILDASAQMIPEALNSLNHLTSLQDPSFGQLNSRQQRFVRFSLRSVRYISQLLTELNDYNRCLLGQMKLQPEPLRLKTIFEEVLAKFHKHIKQKHLVLAWDVDETLGAVMADAYVTRQLFYTMLEHTVDATPISGSIQFRVMPSQEEPAMYTLLVEHDSELELLRSAELDQLFVPFQRPDFDPDDDIPPGLSLSLARELTLLQQGEIEVKQRDQELLFTLHLPLVVEASAPRATMHAFKPLLELPPLEQEWEEPFAARYQLPKLPTLMVSSEQLPAVSSSQQLISAIMPRSSSHLPQPPRSLSSPALPALAPTPPPMLTNPKADLGEADAFLEAANPFQRREEPLEAWEAALELDDDDSFGGGLGTPSPPSRPSHLELLAAEDEGAVTMLSTADLDLGSLSRRSSNFAPPTISPSSAMYPSLLDDDLEAELELEDNAPTQLFHVPSPSTLTPSVFEVASIDGEDSFILEEIDDAEEVEDFMIEDLDDEPEFLTPSGNRLSVQSSMVYLSNDPSAPPPSLFSLFDAWGMPLIEKRSQLSLMESLTHPLPGAVALISTKPDFDLSIALQQIHGTLEAQGLPLLLIHQFPEREAMLQMHYEEFSSDFLKESFWLGWLDRIRHPRANQPRHILSIGLNSQQPEPSPLLRFCCGDGYELTLENNPAAGVQQLYRDPPDLLLIELDAPLEHWCPLLEEVGRSGRTRDIPIVFFCHHEPTEALQRAIKPLHFLFLMAG